MKILFATPYNFPVGGITNWAKHIIGYSNKYSKDIELNILPMDKKINAALQPNTIVRLISSFFEYLHIVARGKTILKQQSYDIVHISSSASFGLIKDIWLINAAHAAGARAIVHFHFGRISALKQANNWEWKFLNKVIRKADCVIVLDELSLQTLQTEGFCNVHKLSNPVAPSVFEYANKNDVKRESRTIYFAGHGLKTKGIFELIEACKRIPNIKVKMAGTISEKVKYSLTILADKKNWLSIVGNQPLESVLLDMLSCDLFVLPTYTEGFPNVILEAMACGCAIVTTPVGAIPEMLEEDENGKYGLMVEPQNSEALYQTIISIIDNEKLKCECRVNAKRRVNERYNMPVVWEQLITIWEQVNNM